MAGRSVVYCLPNENRRFSQREAEALELNLTQKQVQTLSPQMMQSMEILQMGSQDAEGRFDNWGEVVTR